MNARTWISLVAVVAGGCARARVDPGFSAEPRLEATVDALGAEVMKLRIEIASLEAVSDSLRRGAERLDAGLQARDALILALRLELQRLKEIDLKPRVPKPRN